MSRAARRDKPGLAAAARLAAVQALYQVDLGAAVSEDALAMVLARGATLDETGLAAEADPEIASLIVRGVNQPATIVRLDALIDGALTAGWTVERLEVLLRAILRAGVFELLERPDVPTKVVINEYVEVAHAFFDRGEPGMVNAVLDKVARLIRPANELAAPPPSNGG
jgi:transcription antitermination protein NusB